MGHCLSLVEEKACFTGTSWEWTGTQDSSFLGHPWRAVVKRILPVGRTSSSAPGCSLCLEGEMTRCAIIYRCMGYGSWFCCIASGFCKEHDWELWQGNLGKRYVDRNLKWSQNVKIFVYHGNAYPRMTSAEEDFNNWVDRMTHSVGTNQLVSSATPVIPQSGFGGRNRGYAGAQQHGLPLQGQVTVAVVESPICQQQRPTLSPWYGTTAWGDQPATWLQVGYIGSLLSWKEHVLFLLEWTLILGMDLPALHTILLPKQPSVDLQNALPTIIIFHTALLLIKELTLQR